MKNKSDLKMDKKRTCRWMAAVQTQEVAIAAIAGEMKNNVKA